MAKNKSEYSDVSKGKLWSLCKKANAMVNRWTESIILIGAEFYIVCPQHEIWKGNFFAKNTLILILQRVRTMMEISQIQRVTYEYKDGSKIEHNLDSIDAACKKYSNELEK